MNQATRALLGILLFALSSSASAGWMSFFSSSDWQNNPVPVFGPLTVNSVADQDLQPGDDNEGFARFLIQNFTVPSSQVTYALQVQNHGARGVMIALHAANDPGKWRHPFNFFHFTSATDKALISVNLATSEKIGIFVVGPKGSSATVEILGPASLVPPSPVTVAPSLLPGTPSSNLAAGVSFLYTGSNPIQTGVAANAILPAQIAVIRGKALDTSLNPLPAATVTVVGHPEFGQTLTRLDGMFDMAVNGGQTVTLQIAKQGYVLIQRQAIAPLRDYAVIPDFVMTTLDSNVTPITAGSKTTQVAQASTVTDSSGTRTATVIFPPNTTATMVMPDGSTSTLSSLSVRATEVTVGPNGPLAMPAKLPDNSAYTYAIEFSADEALGAGATSVRFSQPVYHYVENFLNFPVGTPVPVGYYDRTAPQWRALPNGRVIKILSVSGGSAKVDVDGNGSPATASELSALSISTGELQKLATLYPAGQSLWRTPVPHFTLMDNNFPYNPGNPNFNGNNIQSPTAGNTPSCQGAGCPPVACGGSTIDPVTQTLGESIPIAGTSFSLHYSSDRVPDNGGAYTINIPLTGSDVTDLLNVRLYVTVAGEVFFKDFYPNSNTSYTFKWDGKDAYGRPVTSPAKAAIEIVYEIQPYYGVPAANPMAFGIPASAPFLTPIPGRSVLYGERTFDIWMETWDSRSVGLGGWTLDVHHTYDIGSHTLFLGDGTKSLSQPSGNLASVFAGTGMPGILGDGGPATSALLSNPTGIAQAADGTVYIAAVGRIRKVSPDGTISTYAGGGSSLADGIPAPQASLGFLEQLAIHPIDGSLYYEDIVGGLIRKISPAGIVSTIATVNRPASLTIGSDGVVYYSSFALPGVFRVNTDGSSFLLPGTDILGTNVGIAYSAPENALYMAAHGHFLKRMPGLADIDLSGLVGNAFQIAPNPAGGVICSTNDGQYFRIVGNQRALVALSAPISSTHQFLVQPDGSLLITTAGQNQVLKVTQKYPGFTDADIQIASSDGAQVYSFDSYGKHLQTADALTGAVIYRFGYDGLGELSSVTDRNGNITFINRGADITIQNPYAQNTHLSTSQNGFLVGVTDPMGHVYQMSYSGTNSSLLSQFTKPNGGISFMTYDALGRLQTDQDAVGAVQQYLHSDISGDGSRFQVTKKSATGVSELFSFQHLLDGSQNSGDQLATFGAQQNQTQADASENIQNPDGTSITITQAPDPRFGYQSAFPSQKTTVLPATATNASIIRFEQKARSIAYSSGSTGPFQLTETFTFNGNTSTTVFDSAPRTQTTTTATGNQSSITYDSLGRVAQTAVSGLTPTEFSYDSRGRIAQITQGPRTSSMTYDSNGYLASLTDALGRTTSYTNDALGHPLGITLPDGRVVQQSFDAEGNLISLTPPGEAASNQIFNLVDILTDFIPPLISANGPQKFHWTYDLDHRPTSYSQPDGSYINYSYDPLTGKLAQRSDSTGDQFNFTYDPVTGYETHAVNVVPPAIGLPNAIYSHSYQGALPTQYRFIQGTNSSSTQAVSYSYNEGFDQSSRTVVYGDPAFATHTTTYTYNADRQLASDEYMTLTRDPQNGLITGTRYQGSPSGPIITEIISRNSFGEITGDIVQSSSQVYYRSNIARDNLGRITAKTETVQGTTTNWTYGYDAQGRLTQVTQNGAVRQYTYDGNGNRLSKIMPFGTENSTYDAQDEILTSGPRTYQFNLAGQLTNITDSSTGLSSQFQNSPINTTHIQRSDGLSIDYLYYDEHSRRTVRFVTKGAALDFEGLLYGEDARPAGRFKAVGGSLIQSYQYLSKSLVPDSYYDSVLTHSFRVVSDERGSVRLVIDGTTGEVAQEIDYDEFGIVTQDTNPKFQPFGFAGGEYDPYTGFVNFGARDYDPLTGRFISRDPIFLSGGINAYSYALDDPINLIDPSGRISLFAGIAIGIGAGAVAGAVVAGGAAILGGAAASAALSAALGGAVVGGTAGGAVGVGASLLSTPLGQQAVDTVTSSFQQLNDLLNNQPNQRLSCPLIR